MVKRRKKAETLVASVAAFNEDGKLLFGLRSDNNKWTLPGGHFEVDDDEEMEDPRHAAVRELREETGLKPTELKYIGHGVVRRVHGNVRVFCFRAKVTGTPTGKDDPDQECATWRWVDVKNGVPQDIEDHLKDRNNVTLRLLGIHEGEVRKHEVDEITGHSSPEPLDPVLMKAEDLSIPPPEWKPEPGENSGSIESSWSLLPKNVQKNYWQKYSTRVPPPGWKPFQMPGQPPLDANQLKLSWNIINDSDRASAWSTYNHASSRTLTESDADFMNRAPTPEQRALSVKLPSSTKKHLMNLVDDPLAVDVMAKGNGGEPGTGAANRAQAIIDHPLFDREVAKHILTHKDPLRTYDRYGHVANAKPYVLAQRKVDLEAGDLEDLVRQFTPNMEHAHIYMNPDPQKYVAWERPSQLSEDRADQQMVKQLLSHPAVSSDQIKRLALYGHDHNPYISANESPEAIRSLSRDTAADIVDEFMKMNDADLIPNGNRAAFMHNLLTNGSLHPETIQKVLDKRHNEPPRVAFRDIDRAPQIELEEALVKNPDLTAAHLKSLMRTDSGNVWWDQGQRARDLRIQALKHKNMTPELITQAQSDPSEQVRYGLFNRHDLITPEHIERAINDDSDLVRQGVAASTKATADQLHRLQVSSSEKASAQLRAAGISILDPRAQPIVRKMDQLTAELLTNPNTGDEQWKSLVRNQAGMVPWLLSDATKTPTKNEDRLNTLVDTITQKAPSGQVGGVLTNIVSSEWPQFNKTHAQKLLAAYPARVDGDAKAKLVSKFDWWTPQELHQIVADNNAHPDVRTAALSHKNAGVETARDVIAGRTLPHEGMSTLALKHPGLTSDELLHEAGARSSSQHLQAIINHPNAGSEHLTMAMRENPDFAADQLRHNPKIKLEHIREALDKYPRTEGNVRAAALGHPLAPMEDVRKAAFNENEHISARMSALNTGRLQEDDLQKIVAAGKMPLANDHGAAQPSIHTRALAEAAQKILEKESPDSVFTERVAVKPGLGKLRKIRDLITAKTGRMFMHQKELPPGDWAPGRGPDGNIHASKLQEHIDKQPALNFNISHSEWDGAQRHSKAPSKVLQVNITSDQIRKMKDAGVYGAFRKMQEASSYSSHPVAKYHGIGWVRYTGGPGRRGGGEKGAPGNYFVDEVQSDFGQSFIRQAAKQAAEAGRDSEQAAQAAAEKYGSEESFKKISQILFGGKHPNEILHEAFQQHLRDKGEAGARIQTHTVESKAPISLGRELPRKCKTCGKAQEDHQWSDVKGHQFNPNHPHDPEMCGEELHVPGMYCGASKKAHPGTGIQDHPFEPGEVDRTKAPGHFNVTYNDVPKKMGMEPSTYGKLRTQSNKEMKGAPTWETKLAKMQKSAEVDDPLRGARIIDDPQGIKQWAKQMDAPVPAPDHVKAQMAPPKFKAGDMIQYHRAGTGWGKLGQQFDAYEGVVQHHMGTFAVDKQNPDKGGHHLYQILRWSPNGQPETAEVNEAGLMHHPGLVKSLTEIKPGPDMGTWNSAWGPVERVDYTHLLSPEQRHKGYKLHVEHRALTDGGKAMSGVITHPEAKNSALWDGRAAEVRGVLYPDGHMKLGSSNSHPDHRGGLGVPLYESVLAHAKNVFGAHTLSGEDHSSLASRVHQKLAAKHGFDYVARPNVGKNKAFDTMEQWEARVPEAHDMKYGHYNYLLKAQLWLAQQKLTKAIDPAHLKPLSRYHDGALGEVFVDHKKEMHAHPDEQTPHVEAFKHHIIDSSDVVKRGKTGTKESSNSTGKVVYEVSDHWIGDQRDHRYMVKPYHEKIVPRARKWMHFPVQGWAEMTNQALYHSAQIGHLHQRVHVTEVPIPSATAPVRTDKGVQEQRKAMWSQVLNEIPSMYPTMDNPKLAQTKPIWEGVMNELGMPPGGGPDAFAAHDKLYRARLEAAGFDPDADTENIPNPAYAPDKAKAVSDQQEATWHQRMRDAGIHWEQQERGPKAAPAPSKMAPALVIHMQPEVSGIQYMSPKHFSPDEKAQARQIGLMDFLTNNLDRHATNLLYDHDRGQMLAIDHSRSFQYKTHDKNVADGKQDSLGNYIRLNSAVKNVIGTKAFGDSSAMNAWNEDWKQTFDWWKQNAPAVRKTMSERLQMIKDRTVRNHIQKNFDVRAKMLDEYARDGHENYGQSAWENTSVPIFQYK